MLKIHVPIAAYGKLNIQSVCLVLLLFSLSLFSYAFVALLFQVFITNLKFQFSQSNESLKLICPLDFAAYTFTAFPTRSPLPSCTVCSFARCTVNFAALNFATTTTAVAKQLGR